MKVSVHETVLYAADPVAAAGFYREVVGLEQLGEADPNGAAFRLPVGDAVLLLFSVERAELEGRGVPTHGARGRGHVAFRVEAGTLDAWGETLRESDIEIEMDRDWERGGRSLYVRDPAGNSVEFVEGRIWAGGPEG